VIPERIIFVSRGITVLCGAGTWTLRKVDQKYLQSFEMYCGTGIKRISWTERVRNEQIFQKVKEERNVLHTMKRKKSNWIGHILRRNCPLKHINEGQIEGTGRRGTRSKQLLDDQGKERIL